MSEGGSSVGFKVVAVISALAIGGSYVAWKGMESAKPNQGRQAQPPRTEGDQKNDLPLIVGSKSPGRDVIVLPEDLFEESDDSLPPLLPGSKSIGGVLFTDKDLEGALWKDELIEVEEAAPLLPGSKPITPIFRPEQEP